jgi:hypothetical protein
MALAATVMYRDRNSSFGGFFRQSCRKLYLLVLINIIEYCEIVERKKNVNVVLVDFHQIGTVTVGRQRPGLSVACLWPLHQRLQGTGSFFGAFCHILGVIFFVCYIFQCSLVYLTCSES